MKKNNFKIKRNGGQAMLISLVFFLFIMLAIVGGLVSPTVKEFKIANDLNFSKQSFYLAESGVEDAYYRLKNGMNIDDTEVISLGNHSVSTEILDSGYNEKSITSVGDVVSRERTNKLVVTGGTGVSFSYGVQVGTGGFIMGNNSTVDGSVYSNGHITGDGAITGTAVSANSSDLTADQTNGSGTPSYNVTFGNANSTQDFAQSFEVSEDGQVNKVKLYLRKVSTPGNLTVRIVADNSGSPGTTTLASGSLSSSLISTTYGWVEVPFSSNPELESGTTYWIVIDGSTNSSRYYQIGANSAGYADGLGKIGQYGSTWSSTTPSDLDGFFELYIGGVTGLISGIDVGLNGAGDAHAHTVNNSNVAGELYCQDGSGNNQSCNTSLSDPAQVAMPISEQNILDWKAEGEAGGVYIGDYTVDGVVTSFGPKKITGNMTVTNNAILTLDGALWVEGNLIVSNNALVKLSSSYDSSEGVIIVDGIVDINNNADFDGSGAAGSYLMVLSTSTSSSAITIENNGGAVILYAANGTINLSNNSGAKALNGKTINLANNAYIEYESGLANSNFVDGPRGGWGITSWQETE